MLGQPYIQNVLFSKINDGVVWNTLIIEQSKQSLL